MKSKATLIVFWVAIFQNATCHLFANTITTMQKKLLDDDGSCNATFNDRKLHRCSIQPSDGMVSDGTVCIYNNTNRGTVEKFLCYKSYFIFLTHLVAGQKRYKRWDIGGDIIAPIVAPIAPIVAPIIEPIIEPIDDIIGKVEDAIPDEIKEPIEDAVEGVVDFICGFICPEGEPPNRPPRISCPGDIIMTAGKHTDMVQVNWTKPIYSDPDGTHPHLTRIGSASGSYFGDGIHTIIYRVTDDHGLSEFCSFQIKITVISCLPDTSLYVENGRADCVGEKWYGDTCSFLCNSGYELSGNATVTCEKDGERDKGIWSKKNFTCKRIECDQPEHFCNGEFLCPRRKYYETVCFPKCKDGYSTDIYRQIQCDGVKWTGIETILPCIDIEPPVVTCPPDVHVFADVSETAVVNWEDPIATDNSESDNCTESKILITQISGSRKGTAFKIGTHKIEYKVIDASKNSQACQFEVNVERLFCEPLTVSDEYLNLRCNEGFSLGSVCTFSCFMSYVMVGSPNVTCVKDPLNENRAIWDWSNGTETFCDKLTCPDLPAPAGGALACSIALGNTICTMACSNKTRVPLGTSIQYMCSVEQTWIPGVPPNCTDRVHPDEAIKPGDLFYYYDGDCSDPTVQEGIKDNFLNVMHHLDKQLANICPDHCSIDGVTVTCGPLNGRKRKRSLFHYLMKRATHEITISFNVKSRWQTNKDLWENDNNLLLLSSVIEKQVSNGSFDVPGMTTGVVNFGWIEMNCPSGLVPKYGNDAACDGCPPGKYLKDRSCHDCEKGSYQEMEFQLNCTLCTEGKSTEGTGSTSSTQCKDKCAPGTYSTFGVKPCSPCRMGQYQTEAEATSCYSCDQSKWTASVGSTKESDCKVMDVALAKKNSMVTLMPLENSVSSFTTAFWMKCANSSRHVLTASLGRVMFSIGQDFNYSVPSKQFSKVIKNEIDLTKWAHLAISSDSTTKDVFIYGNGVKLASFELRTVESHEMTVPVGSRLKIKSETIGCVLSGFYMVGKILTPSAIENQSKVCHTSLPEALYTMDSIYKAESSYIQFSPTSCDAIDECLSNPCNTGNICKNKLGGFSCICTRGYSGSTCQIPPDFCINNACQEDSTCVSHFNNYTCTCSPGFTGTYCENQIVHGNWGNWYNTSECSASCNGGVRTRERYCNNPGPNTYGRNCVGKNKSTVNCNEHTCPECKPWHTIRQYRNSFNCTTSGDVISCIVTCLPGYSFVREYPPLEIYQCGPQSSFKWLAKPPPCAPVRSALSLSTTSSVNYEVECSSKESFVTLLTSSLDHLRCVGNDTCSIQTRVTGCSQRGKVERSLSTLEVTIHLFSNLSSLGDLNLVDFYANKIVSPSLLEMLQIYGDMDKTIYQMKSTSMLTINGNGFTYEADMATFNFTINVTCRDGQVAIDLMCVECPSGTHWNDGFCVICPEGTYQNRSGRLECKRCPTGFTTDYIGSQSVEECNVPDYSTQPPSRGKIDVGDENEYNTKLIIILVVIITSVLILALVIGIIVSKARSTKSKRLTIDGKKPPHSANKSLDVRNSPYVNSNMPSLSQKELNVA